VTCRLNGARCKGWYLMHYISNPICVVYTLVAWGIA